MATSASPWKPGRGKLGVLKPLLGEWYAEATSPMGPVKCWRTLGPVLDGKFVRLTARWEIGSGGATRYEEWSMLGPDKEGRLSFRGFASDGKQSAGQLTDATDVHPDAIGFEVEVPAGTARMVYWPDGAGGFYWAVESRNQKGWHRFTEHRYGRLSE